MPGASKQTRQVKVLNANWTAGPDGDDGRFQVMLVTDDDQQHTITPSPARQIPSPEGLIARPEPRRVGVLVHR